MVIIDGCVQGILDNYRDTYCDFHKRGEYGMSRFWIWYINTIRGLENLDSLVHKNCISSKRRIGSFVVAIYSCQIISNEPLVKVENI